MKKRILVALAGSLIILSVWIFVPEVDEGPVVFASVDEAEVIYESETSEESIQEEVRDESDGIFYEIARRNKKLDKEKGNGENTEYSYKISSRFKQEVGSEQETGEEIERGITEQGGEISIVSNTVQTSNNSTWDFSKNTEICETRSSETVEEQIDTERETTVERVEEVESNECSGEMASSSLQQPESTEGCDEIPVIPYYSVNGAILDLDIQRYLYQRLAEKGIGWFMPYAIMIAFQESHFNPRAENKNGIDKGLFQYRITYYPGGDIFNPYEQIDIFTQQMANRANAGCSVNEMISRHMMSDYGAYNQVYVNQVLQHQAGLALISN